MFLTNPFYSFLFEYTKKVNDNIDENIFETNYKSYIKEDKNNVCFNIFDIESKIKTKSGINLYDIKYENLLNFTFKKNSNEITINKIPVYKGKTNVKIPVFTNDICKIIIDSLKKVTDCKDFEISFSDSYSPIVLDIVSEKVFPTLTKTNNYKITKKIICNVEKELNNIKKTVNSYKLQQDRKIKIMERIYESRRKIYGVDPKKYKTVDEFYNAVKKELSTKLKKILNRINIQLDATEKKYKELEDKINTNINLEKILKEDKDYFNIVFFIAKHIVFISEAKDKINVDIVDFILNHFTTRLSMGEKINQKDLEILIECMDRINILYNGKIFNYNIRSKAKNVSKYEGFKFVSIPSDEDIETIADVFYTYKNIYKYNHDFLNKHYHLLNQFRSLMIEKDFYTNVLKNIDDYTLSQDKYTKSSYSRLDLPYLYCSYQKHQHNKNGGHGDLLLINPGVKNIDFNKIPIMSISNDELKEPDTKVGHNISAYRRSRVRPKYNLYLFENKKYFDLNSYKFRNSKHDDSRSCITIPSSLQYTDIKKIIQYFGNMGNKVCYICENGSVYTCVKSLLIDEYLEKIINNKKNITRSYVVIDPNYRDNYFTNVSTPFHFFKKYDYTSNYKFRKKDVMSIEDLCQIYINRQLDNSNKIDVDLIKLSMLGSYNINDINSIEKFDQYKYTILNYYVKSRTKVLEKDDIHKKDNIEDYEFYSIFGNKDPKVKEIFSMVSCQTMKAHFRYMETDRKWEEYADKILYDVKDDSDKNCCVALWDDKDINWDLPYHKLCMVTKDEDGYRKLTEEEIEKDFYKLGKTENISVAFYTDSDKKIQIWKNYPYTPADVEEISHNKVKTYKIPENYYDDDYEIPF